MRCPHCETENRDDRPSCYHCGKDLAMLRLINNQARQHFNRAVAHAEGARYYEALGELNNALELNARMADGHVLRGTILARLDRMDEAREAWDAALALNPQAMRAHRYLAQAGDLAGALPVVRRARTLAIAGAAGLGAAALLLVAGFVALRDPDSGPLREGYAQLQSGDLAAAHRVALRLRQADSRERLLGAVDAAVNDRLAAIEAVAPLEPIKAAQRLAALPAQLLPDSAAARVRALSELLEQEVLSRVESAIAAGEADAGAMAQAHDLAERAVKSLPALRPAVDALRERSQVVAAARVEAMAAKSMEALPGDPAAALARLEDARRLADGSGLPAPASITTAENALVGVLAGLIATAEGGDDRVRLDELAMMANRLGTPGAPPEAQLLGARAQAALEKRRVDRLVIDLNAALDAGDIGTIARLRDEMDSLGMQLDAEQSRQLAQAQRLAAVRAYQKLMAMGDRIEAAEFTNGEAEEIISLAELAENHLPAHLAARAEENLIFFQLAANMQLGRGDAATRLRQRMTELSPNSPYLARVAKPLED